MNARTTAAAPEPGVRGEHDLYDERARLGRLRHLNSAAAPLATYTWLYDAGDRITRMTSNDGTVTYSHDATNQLTAADHSSQDDEGYAYDRNGNRTGAFAAAAPNRVTTYTKDDITYTYAYDNEGNRISRTKLDKGVVVEYVEYTWDHRNRLTRVLVRDKAGDPIKKEAAYTYDVFDRRLTKTVDQDGAGTMHQPVTTRFVYDGSHIALVFEGSSSTATLTHRYLHGPMIDEILADETVADGSLLWPLTDHLGTVRDLATASGAVPAGNHIQYESFGKIVAPAAPPAALYFAFTGREWDRELDQYYYRGRYYDPQTGTFISEDPSGFDGGDPNLYRYVYNAPLSAIDPSGRSGQFCDFNYSPFREFKLIFHESEITISRPVPVQRARVDIFAGPPSSSLFWWLQPFELPTDPGFTGFTNPAGGVVAEALEESIKKAEQDEARRAAQRFHKLRVFRF